MLSNTQQNKFPIIVLNGLIPLLFKELHIYEHDKLVWGLGSSPRWWINFWARFRFFYISISVWMNVLSNRDYHFRFSIQIYSTTLLSTLNNGNNGNKYVVYSVSWIQCSDLLDYVSDTSLSVFIIAVVVNSQ
mgnify:CR=1 FL=1